MLDCTPGYVTNHFVFTPLHPSQRIVGALTLLLCAPAFGEAEPTEEEQPAEEEILVTAERPVSAASDQTIRDRDFQYFPRRTASDLMRLVPGLHLTQHTGGAKAHQLFLRGFDAEHGQDVAAYLDGIPLNESSHVHGQGYLDLHFLIPEAIRRIRVLKGPYEPALGNYSTAGAVRFETAPIPEDLARVRVGLGSFHTWSALGELGLGGGGKSAYLALQAGETDGFTRPGATSALRAFARTRWEDPGGWRLDALLAGYAARSQAADTLPLRWIEEGRIGRFEALDPTNRVDVERALAGLSLAGPLRDGRLTLAAHYGFKDTRIFSNFTYFYYHEERGDQLEQSDRRHHGGLTASYSRAHALEDDRALLSEVGLQWRMDGVLQTQANTRARVRFNTMNHYDFQEHGLGLYVREQLLLGERFSLLGGLRYDAQLVDIQGVQDVRELDIYTNRVVLRDDQPRGALALAHALSPRLSAVLSLPPAWTLFANAGRGFVSRPARDQADRPEAWAHGVTAAELGARYSALEGALSASGSAWWTHKERELVFDSEFGGTVLRGQSHRVGLDLELRWAPLPWMWLATDLSVLHTRLEGEDGWGPIPNAPWLLMTHLLALQHPWGLHASLRGRLVGPREHDLGRTSGPSYVLDLVLAWEARHFGLVLEVENLLDVDWYDSVFAYPTRPRPGAEVDDGLQVTAGTPFAARLTLTLAL